MATKTVTMHVYERTILLADKKTTVTDQIQASRQEDVPLFVVDQGDGATVTDVQLVKQGTTPIE